MTKEIDIFNGKEIASFNGSNLSVNLKKADIAIIALADDFRIHNHSNTQFAWNHFVLTHKEGLRNIRQITAEINKKSLALHEAKYKHGKTNIQLKRLNSTLTSPNLNEFDKMEIELEAQKITSELKFSLAPIEGAVKDIISLKAQYDILVAEHKGYTEKDLEEAEAAYWIKRLVSQALADIRECGAIRAGNQLSIEQLSINISALENDANAYLKIERASTDRSGRELQAFLITCVELYLPEVSNNIIVDSLYTRENT